MTLYKFGAEGREPMTAEEEAAERERWAKAEQTVAIARQDQRAIEYAKWIERKQRNTRAMATAPAEIKAALQRLNAKCDLEIAKYETP